MPPPPHLQAMDVVCVVCAVPCFCNLERLLCVLWLRGSPSSPKLLTGEQSSSEREIFMPRWFPPPRFHSAFTVSLLRSRLSDPTLLLLFGPAYRSKCRQCRYQGGCRYQVDTWVMRSILYCCSCSSTHLAAKSPLYLCQDRQPDFMFHRYTI